MIEKDILGIVNDFAQVLIKGLRKELVAQGHKMTGSLSKSLESEVKAISNGISLIVKGNDYGAVLNNGVKANRIPFSQGSGATSSKYIQGLQRFVKARITSNEKKSLGIAFAIAKTHKKEGMPSKGSLRFSNNGRRTGWIDYAVKDTEKEFSKLVRTVLAKKIEKSLVL